MIIVLTIIAILLAIIAGLLTAGVVLLWQQKAQLDQVLGEGRHKIWTDGHAVGYAVGYKQGQRDQPEDNFVL